MGTITSRNIKRVTIGLAIALTAALTISPSYASTGDISVDVKFPALKKVSPYTFIGSPGSLSEGEIDISGPSILDNEKGSLILQVMKEGSFSSVWSFNYSGRGSYPIPDDMGVVPTPSEPTYIRALVHRWMDDPNCEPSEDTDCELVKLEDYVSPVIELRYKSLEGFGYTRPSVEIECVGRQMNENTWEYSITRTNVKNVSAKHFGGVSHRVGDTWTTTYGSGATWWDVENNHVVSATIMGRYTTGAKRNKKFKDTWSPGVITTTNGGSCIYEPREGI